MVALYILLTVLEVNGFIVPPGCKAATIALLALSLLARIIQAVHSLPNDRYHGRVTNVMRLCYTQICPE